VHITLVSYQNTDFPEVFWLKRLLRGFSIELVEDLTQTKVVPNSIVICKRLRRLSPGLLKAIAATPGIILFHISDEWYLDRLEAYRSFAHVLRNYHHTALQQDGITQIPMGPGRSAGGQLDIRPTGERVYKWCFLGNLASTRGSLVHHLEDVKPGYLHITGTRHQSAKWLSPEDYFGILRNTIFVPCPMGNVNLESFRLYEALDCGGIPIVERRPWLDYFTELLGPHPLPSVCHWRDAPSLMRALSSNPARLRDKQVEVGEWWQRLEANISRKITDVINVNAGRKTRVPFAAGIPSRLRGACELLKHHNDVALLARVQLTARRLFRAA
jgi:hypothetical protein